jgi:tight adherence protein B
VIAATLAGVAGALLVVGVVLVAPAAAAVRLPVVNLRIPLATAVVRAREVLRRRVRVAGALGGALAGTATFGMREGVVLAAVGAWLAPYVATARRRRHGRRLDEGAATAARAIADALASGASLRASVAVAAHRLTGPIAAELGRTAWELEMGGRTDAALERLRSRSASRAVGLIVAAMLVQRRCGGDLARVLREVAVALEQDRQVIEEADAATAQARFTAIVVVALPVCGVALGALASPGLPGRMAGSPVGAGLLFASLVLQVVGVLTIRRLSPSWN